jgi:hypothetical protein
MNYEFHLTVEDSPSILQSSLFCDYVRDKIDGKTVFIELSNGKHPLQLMLGLGRHFEHDSEAIGFAHELSATVQKDGWDVRRMKVESPIDTDNPATYYEAHWKVLCYPDYIGKDLEAFCREQKLLLSRNLFDKRHRLVSVRDYGISSLNATARFNSVSTRLELGGFNVTKFHYERVAFDSNRQLDEGWK